MKKQTWVGTFVLALVSCFALAPAHAQDMGKISVFGGYSYQQNNYGLSAYNCNFSYNCLNSGFGMHGYALSVGYNFNKIIGLEANFSGHNGGTTASYIPTAPNNTGDVETMTQDIYTYTFGPKISLPIGKFSLFSHFLVGGVKAHVNDNTVCVTGTSAQCGTNALFNAKASGNGMAMKTGAGLDWNHGHWGIRILEVDYVHASASTPSYQLYNNTNPYTVTYPVTANNFELATGFTVNFK